MFRWCHELKHFNTVVRLLSEMVDKLITGEGPTKMPFHHEAMFKDLLRAPIAGIGGVLDNHVTLCIDRIRLGALAIVVGCEA